jgi:hypothetical protein
VLGKETKVRTGFSCLALFLLFQHDQTQAASVIRLSLFAEYCKGFGEKRVANGE